MSVPSKVVELDFGGTPRRKRARRRGPLSPNDMLTFAAVARAGGVRNGALVLGVPRSTVSRQLAALEKVLGARLVARSTRQFSLTELGSLLLQQCTQLEAVMKATDEVIAHTSSEPTGTLRVAASPIVGDEFLPEIIVEYLRRHPRVSVEVELSVDFVDLRRGGFDVAVRTGPIQEASDLYATRLGTSLKGHYASRAYLKARGTPQVPQDLEQHDCIVVGGPKASAWAFRFPGAERLVDVKGRLRVDSYRLARSAALSGVGVARIPDVFAQAYVANGQLVPVLEKYWPRTVLYAVHAAGQPAPPKIRAFVEMVRTGMKDILPAG